MQNRTMKRKKLLNLLHNYHPQDPHEIEAKKQIINFVKENPDCFERRLESGHVTASCWLLNYDRTKALLMHHKKLNKWVQLGGHCDGNSDVLEVAMKEAQEESGIVEIAPISREIFDIDIHISPKTAKEKEHFHYDIRFLLGVTQPVDFVKNEESNELRWVTKNIQELPTQQEAVVRMFKKWVTFI